MRGRGFAAERDADGTGDRSDTCAVQGRWLACLGLRTADGRADPIVLAVSAAGDTLKPLRDGAPSFTLGVSGDAGAVRTLRSPDGVVLHGMLGGVKLFADADGVPAGLLVEGYMYAEIFVTRGTTREALGRMIAAVAQERGHQAE